jgi:hypothetical protein
MTHTLDISEREAGIIQAGLNALLKTGGADLGAAEEILALNRRLIAEFAEPNGKAALEATEQEGAH